MPTGFRLVLTRRCRRRARGRDDDGRSYTEHMRLRGRGTARLGGSLTSEALDTRDPEIRCPMERYD